MPTAFVQIYIPRAGLGTAPRAWMHTDQPHQELKWTQVFRSSSNLLVGPLLLQLPHVQ